MFADKHLSPFKTVLDDVLNVDLGINCQSVGEYLTTLLKSAEEAEKFDAFSKVALFNETQFEVGVDKELGKLIDSVRQLMRILSTEKSLISMLMLII